MAKVLIIESDEGTRYLYTTALNFQKFDVTSTDSIKKGIELIKKDGIDLVLLDLMVPDLSEVNFIDEFRSANIEKLPTIVIVNPRNHEVANEAKLMNAFDYMYHGESTIGDVIRSARKAIG
jgi:DNA-binding NtrC family response regulator